MEMQHHQSKDFARDFERSAATERKRSLSTTTDSSVASILSNSEQLIPDVFMPKDIQVLSQRRQHQHHRRKKSSMGSSRVSNSSYQGVHVVRTNAVVDQIFGKNATRNFDFGIKTASSSFGYSDDESNVPAVVSSRRADHSAPKLQVQ